MPARKSRLRPWEMGATPTQTEALDRFATARFLHPLDAMLERAGRGLANLAASLAQGRRILVLSGPGTNGAGGLRAARLLHQQGHDVAFLQAGAPQKPETFHAWQAAKAAGVASTSPEAVKPETLVVDALLGYRQRWPMRGDVRRLLEGLGPKGGAWLSLDVATGVNPRTGRSWEPHAPSHHVLALACVKTGTLQGPPCSVSILDIGIPEGAYLAAGIERPPFARNGLLALAERNPGPAPSS